MLTNLVDSWIESVFFKRAIVALAAYIAASWASHSGPVLALLATDGIHIGSVTIDQAALANALSIALSAGIAGAHDWAVKKLPGLGKLIGGGIPLLIVCLLLAGDARPVRAQQQVAAPAATTPTPSLSLPFLDQPVNLSGLIANTHPCFVYDQHREKLGGAYLPALSFHRGDGVSIVDLNAGAAWNTSTGIGGPFGAVGIRWDNLIPLLDTNKWFAGHTTMPPMPHFEAGPWGGYILHRGWLYGAFVSVSL